MTGFASAEGAESGPFGRFQWRWEARSVNGRGLDVRVRAPNGWDRCDAAWRALAAERFARGSITISLNVDMDRGGARGRLRLNAEALADAIAAAKQVDAELRAAGLSPAAASVEGLLGVKGVLEGETDAGCPTDLAADEAAAAAVTAGLAAALDGLAAARAAEGERLAATATALLDEIEALTAQARARADARRCGAGDRLTERVAALLGAGAPKIEEGRIAQELALLAVKADVREELDRLAAHMAAARDLVAARTPSGRKFDFLVQEFHREANTLCAKAQDAALTETGLALKHAIDQLKEQAANVE